MKKFGFVAMLVIVLALGLAFVSCDNGTTGPGPTSGGSLTGTYGYTSTGYLTITFNSNRTFVGNYSGYSVSGSYTVQGNTIQLSRDYFGRYWTIINSSTVMDESGDYWRRR